MGRFLSHEASCGRARSWVSHEVDGELSQFERVFLAAHLRRCGECSRFAEEVRSFTRLVREAPLERPERAFEFPARRPARLRVVTGRVAIATMLVALAGGLGVLVGSNGGRSTAEPVSAVGDVALVIPQADRELRDLRRVKVEQPRERVAPPGRLGGNV